MAKDSSRITAGDLQKKIEFWAQNILKEMIKQPQHRHMLFGRASRKKKKKKKSRKENAFTKKQSPAYSVVRHDWNFKWDWLLWSDETKNVAF